MQDHSLAGWEKVMTLNITAPFVLTKEIGRRAFIPSGAGKILNIASIGGLGGNRSDLEMFTIAYNTSKAAMINFTRTLAAEWGRYDINVNALAPGFSRPKCQGRYWTGSRSKSCHRCRLIGLAPPKT